MKKLLTNPIAIFVSILFCGYMVFLQINFTSAGYVTSGQRVISLPESDTAFGGLFYMPFINDSLPHYEYAKISDSLKQIKEERELINRSISTGVRFGAIGTGIIQDYSHLNKSKIAARDSLSVSMMDSIVDLQKEYNDVQPKDSGVEKGIEQRIKTIMDRYRVRINQVSDSLSNIIKKKYYLSLGGYKLDHDTKFFIEDEKYNLAYVVWDTLANATYDSIIRGHYERKGIPVRYSKEEEKILIPITASQHSLANALILGFSWLVLAFTAFFLFGLPLQIMISISKREAFTLKNIRRLNLISLYLFIVALFASFFPYVLHFLAGKMIVPDFQLASIWFSIYKNLNYYFFAAIVFIISIAFKKGYKLQQEQELTV